MDFENLRIDDLPEPYRRAIAGQLEPDERVAAILRVDLDTQLHFANRFLVLTENRLLVVGPPNVASSGVESSRPSDCVVSAWPLSQVVALTIHDKGGLGHLDVLGHDRRLALLNFTLGHAAKVHDFLVLFDQVRKRASLPGDGELAPAEEAEIAQIPEAEEQPLAANVGSLFRLFRFARRRVGAIVLGMILTLATTAFGLVAPTLMGPLTDEVLDPYSAKVAPLLEAIRDEEKKPQPDQAKIAEARAELATIRAEGASQFRKVPWYLALMIGSALAAWGLGWWQGWVLAWLSERISADLRNFTYEHLQRLSLDFFSAKRTGDLVARISSDTDRICTFLSDSLTDFVTDVLMIVGTLVVLFTMSPIMALGTVCTFPVMAWLTWWIRDRLQHGFLTGGRAWADMTSILADTIPGVRVVKAFAQERRETERFRASNERIMAANDRVNKVWTFFWPVVALLNQAGLIVVWALAAWLVFEQKFTMGQVVAATALVNRLYTRLESMSRMATTTQRAAASAQRIYEILDRVPSVAEPAHPVAPGNIQGTIEIRDVSFRYGNRRVIDHVTLSIRPGEMIGLVGTTGAGKSTLVNLVCRFYDVSDGAIHVDGIDVRSFRIAEYRRHIGIVLQDPFLFYGTIAENIAYGKPQATREEIIGAARAARAHEFILQLPDGYDSIVGERGQTLSGGERQRISIARALLIDPRILILDEATSSVDTETERQIQEALDNLVRGRTTIAIAHRLSTLRKADRLVVLERGEIVEIGNHQELLARPGGTYAKLYEAQMQLAQEFSSPPPEEPPPLVADIEPNDDDLA